MRRCGWVKSEADLIAGRQAEGCPIPPASGYIAGSGDVKIISDLLDNHVLIGTEGKRESFGKLDEQTLIVALKTDSRDFTHGAIVSINFQT